MFQCLTSKSKLHYNDLTHGEDSSEQKQAGKKTDHRLSESVGPLLFSNQKAAEGGDLVRCQHMTLSRQAYIHLVISIELQAGAVSSIVGVLGALFVLVKRLDNNRVVFDQTQPRLMLFCSLIEEGEAVIACNRGFEDACGDRRAIITRKVF